MVTAVKEVQKMDPTLPQGAEGLKRLEGERAVQASTRTAITKLLNING